jgi:hypothetical protein
MSAERTSSRHGATVALTCIVVATIAVRWRLLGVPLERDEGEYAYMAQLILRGDVPYVAAHNMKLPGTYYAYATILALLGESDVAIRVGLIALNVLAVGIIYRIGRALVDTTAGVVGAAAYATLSVGPAVLGFTANAEHFVLLPALAGVVALARRRSGAGALVSAGLLLGLGYVMKQPGAAFVAFGALELATRPRTTAGGRGRVADVALFLAAAVVPFAVTCVAMWALGAFQPFWFWTVTYAREYVAQIPLDVGLAHGATVARDIVRSAPLFWLLAAAGITALVWDARSRGAARFVGLFLACSIAAVSPGLRFSDHYFLLLLPAASLLAGIATSALARALPSVATAVRIGVPAAAVLSALMADRTILFTLPPDAVARAVYGVNPFPEAREIGRYLREHTTDDERVAVVGSEPEIYFYARRRAATSYIYTYPLMEPHPFAQWMQDEMVRELEAARPRFLVLVSVDMSWSRRPTSSGTIFAWTERTVNAEFTPVGVVEITRDAPARYRWGPDAAAPPRTAAHVVIVERVRSPS